MRYQECYSFWRPAIDTAVEKFLQSEGVFLPDGSFVPLPKLATEPFLKLWEQEVFKLFLAEGKKEIVANIRGCADPLSCPRCGAEMKTCPP